MTVWPSTFSSGKLSNKSLKLMEQYDVVEFIMLYTKYQMNQVLEYKGGMKKTKLSSNTNLGDTDNTGTVTLQGGTLIVTKWDSAKTLPVLGLSGCLRGLPTCLGLLACLGLPACLNPLVCLGLPACLGLPV